MRKTLPALLLFALPSFGGSALQTSPPASETASTRVRHRLDVTLDPSSRRIRVTDDIALPPGARVDLLLNASFAITQSEPALEEAPLGEAATFFGINAGSTPGSLKLKRYRSRTPASTLRVTFEGVADFGLGDAQEEYTRGFRETIGLLNAQGVYLSGASFWYPYFGPELVEFEMTVAQPASWHTISQGNGTSRGENGRARWESHGAMDEIYLVGGPLSVYRDSAGAVETLAYLRDAPDAASTAARYLEATAQYIEMYRSLIGPYPYGKFALVENFWETGYGMPSFTLLGPQIIRFPFILSSSYPHEVLHNWWGNSVFVDYETGNWCEGLTSYMADYLIQEQRGTATEYRRATLQKYRDFVKDGRDFPLTEFRSRHSAATEAVGYGRTLMGFHMLRREMGDDAFRKFTQRFYREFAGRRAGFRDIQKLVESVASKSFGRFFEDWIARPGAPALALTAPAVRKTAGGYELTATLRQTQTGAPFDLTVPLVVRTSRGPRLEAVRLTTAETPVVLTFAPDSEPLAIDVDPEFDLFRRLDPRETPTSLGQIFGEPRVLALVPARASAEERRSWQALVESWRSDSHAVEIRLDTDVNTLPSDRAVWLLGRSNTHAATLFGNLAPQGAAELRIDGESMPFAGHTTVLTERHPRNPEKAVGWIFGEPFAALPGLGRKLPHYGKYSYLGFQGDEPVNVLKGQWTAADSPLHVDLRGKSSSASLPALETKPRAALADLPPVFSRNALMGHVNALAAPSMKGRALGTPELSRAADYIADQFKAIGLEPGGPSGSYFQKFLVDKGPHGTPVETANVIGILRGGKAEWKDESAVLSAHYDHLGTGWPDVHKGDEGQVHPGADDNASGVSVLIELAKTLRASGPPSRTIVFAAFSGEEAGLKGSAYYTEHPVLPLEKIIGVINLDTVGRLGREKIAVLGAGTASEWQHIFRGAGFVTGVEGRIVMDQAEGSDQMSFIRKNVPAIQLFTNPNADYHRPTDTVDKIDAGGLVKVAAYAREGIAYLAERDRPLTNTIRPAASTGQGPGASPAAAPTGRRVTFGSVPDFAFSGPGVRLSGVTPGSPAEKAGMKEGDVITRLGETVIPNLGAFSEFLRGASAGQKVDVTILREGKELRLEVTLVER